MGLAPGGLVAISCLFVASLLWLIYARENLGLSPPPWTASLTWINASLNALTALFLLVGVRAVRAGYRKRHQRLMVAATLTSLFFLVGYILYHFLRGETPFEGTGPVRLFYFALLISHIILSAVQVPLILLTHFFAWRGQFSSHRKVARWTYPIWLFVSVTGVLIFGMLKVFNENY